MTINEMTAAFAAEGHFANGDYAARFNISDTEAERIAEKSSSTADFVRIWENEEWWRDQ